MSRVQTRDKDYLFVCDEKHLQVVLIAQAHEVRTPGSRLHHAHAYGHCSSSWVDLLLLTPM